MAERKTAARYKKKTTEPVRIRIKKNDVVKVISGRDKGKTGRVLEVNSDTGRLLVEGVQMIKRHTRPNPAKQIKGGIAEKESSIHASNVMVFDGGRCCHPHRLQGGERRKCYPQNPHCAENR